MKKSYSYLLFDWDGCLADTLSIWLNAYIKVFKEFNSFPSEKEITGQVFGDWNGPLKFGITDIAKFNTLLLSEVNKGFLSSALHLYVKDTLVQLKQAGKHLAIITSSTGDSVLPQIKKYGLGKLIDIFLSKEDVVHYKPHPEVVEKALLAMKANKKLSVIIGDMEKDIRAGKNAGIDSAVFYPEKNRKFYSLKKLRQEKPTFLFSDFRELLRIVN